MKIFNLLIIIWLPVVLFANEQIIGGEIIWYDNIEKTSIEGEEKKFLAFQNANYNEEEDYLAYYSERLKLINKEIVSVNIVDSKYEDLLPEDIESLSGKEFIKNKLTIKLEHAIFKKQNYGIINFSPIIYNSKKGKYQKLLSYKLLVETRVNPSLDVSSFKKSWTSNSVLSSGEWFKIGVVNDGVFKLTYSFLKNLGIDVDALNPTNIKIYGNGGGMLPEDNLIFREDDLKQNSIFVKGETDGVFNTDDYVLFYGQSPHKWSYDSQSGHFTHELNRYSDTTFYYITYSNTGESPKRIINQSSSNLPNINVNSFNDYLNYEKDLYNLIRSGREWYGDQYDLKTSYTYSFNFSNIDLNSKIHIRVNGAARSSSSSYFNVLYNGQSKNIGFASVNTGCYSCIYADSGEDTLSVLPSDDVVSIGVTYSKPTSSSVAWMNKVEVNARRSLKMVGKQMFFRDTESVGIGNIANFSISGASDIIMIWDVSDPYNIKQNEFSPNSTISFVASASELKEYVALTSDFRDDVYPKGKVENQNLHALAPQDMIIVSHPLFIQYSNQIADFHREEGLRVFVVTPEQIYNEFSSGSQDIVAIRDFIRMFYERAVTTEDLPKYLLLFGDGSYDNKNRLTENTNFIPTYQSVNSLGIVGSLVSDDFYGLLDVNEGDWIGGTEYVDIGIGRFPVKTIEEAENVVNKVLNYNTTLTMKDWRNKIAFVGDDEDSNTHMSQSNSLASMVENGYPEYNENKIFFDAFKQESTPGGSRYPDVNQAISDVFDEGALIFNYTGHGGETGLAHERVLTINQINSFENVDNLPLVVTATCEFSRFDDPKRTSAGELVLLNEGGGVALLTTVRLVYSSPNFSLNQSFYNKVFEEVNGDMPTIGHIFMDVKNLNAANANNRNFTLLGDPALRLAYPINDVVTSKFNGVQTTTIDTVRALEKVTVEGYVQDKNGNKLSNYNGIIYPTVFDKKKQITTLSNDGGTPFIFDLQTSKLFKGKVSVENGDFSFSFIVPKDISYNFDKGKISYYAENQVEDANGYFKDFYIGGTSDNYEVDNEGPSIDLYLNDKTFVFGGLTDENPILLAYVSDIHGINMVGNGIGHDIIAVLDEKTDEAFILNDYYEADLNSYQKGVIKFPFQDLSVGRHKLTLKVWDVYNNSTEVTTEFIVEKERDIVIDRVYNYPNPFTTHTEFWFEHNQANKQMYAQVQIFTVSGKLVKTIEKNITNEGFRSTSIEWDGLDEYGDRLAKGVYVYRLKVRAENLSIADKYQKLVIL